MKTYLFQNVFGRIGHNTKTKFNYLYVLDKLNALFAFQFQLKQYHLQVIYYYVNEEKKKLIYC